LLPAGAGALQSAMPASTRSLMLVFPSPEHAGEEVKVGAVVDTVDGSALMPGSAGVSATVRFWVDEAAIYAVPGVSFTLWYGRPVGKGVVVRLVDEAASC
jgi:hypothetical protein